MQNHTLSRCVEIAAVLCKNDEDLLRKKFRLAIEDGIDIAKIREVILTSYLFDGYPTALEGFRILFEVLDGEWDRKSSQSITYDVKNIALWRERGIDLCSQVYDRQFASLMQRIKMFAPELLESMLIEGYGKVLSRNELDIKYRELCVVVMLAVKGRYRQLFSHILGALRVGCKKSDVLYAFHCVKECIPEKYYIEALDLLVIAVESIQRQMQIETD